MEAPVLPPPPEETILDFYKVARRWKSAPIVVESQLEKAGIEFVPVPQKLKKGVRLSDLLEFERHWRQTESERQARIGTERIELRRREEERDRRQTEARARLEQKKAEADLRVAAKQEAQQHEEVAP
jgi:hypothetical protein